LITSAKTLFPNKVIFTGSGSTGILVRADLGSIFPSTIPMRNHSASTIVSIGDWPIQIIIIAQTK
jgi:hypothetical protein